MKKSITFRVFFIVTAMYISLISVAQISKQQAIDIVMDSVVGVKSTLLDVSISPNSANSWVAFNYSLPETSMNSSIEIHNAMGELVHRINLTTNHGQEVWDTRSVIPGFYLFSLKSSDMVESGKLIISK